MENGLAVLAVGPSPVADAEVAPADTAPVNLDLDYHLTMVVRQFQEADDATLQARTSAERCRDYYDGKQLTEAELAVYRKRNQPPVIANYVKRKVDFLLGYERKMRSDPKAFPRNPQDQDASEAATDALRFIGDQNNMNETRSAVFENMMIEGFGGAEVVVEADSAGNPRISIRHVPWDRIYYDPHSRRADFADRTYDGIVLWLDVDTARTKWPGRVVAIDNTLSTVSISSTYDDRPQSMVWCDNRRRRIRICQAHYEHGGEWYICTFTRGGFLEDPVPSPYLDKDGKSTSPLRLRSAYTDRENNRYGAVKDMLSLQDELNKRRSKALHLFNTRQTYGNQKAVQDTQAARRELAKADGHVDINADAEFGKDFGIIPTGDMAQGQIVLLEHVTSELQTQGPNAALAGKDPRQQSGRAIQAQQQGGAVEMEPLSDGLRQWTRDVYEVCWMCARQYWTGEKWVRVTDDERNIKFVGLNQQVTLEQMLSEMPPDQRAQMMQAYGLGPNDPRLQEVVETRNAIADLDVDIEIEEGPDVSTLMSEQFEELAGLAKSGVPIPPKAIIQASSLRNKDQILDEMEKGQQLPPAVQKQMQEMQQQLAQANQRLQQQDVELRNRAGELALRNRELDIKAAEVQMRAGQSSEQPADPVAQQLDAAQKLADIEKTQADTDQTRVETAMLTVQPQAPEFKGTISA